MKIAKKSELGIKTFLLIAVPLLGLWVYTGIQENKQKEKYLDTLNLQLQGIVRYLDTPKSSNGFGIIGVDVLRTNKAMLNTSMPAKYCVVENNKAEFYQLGAENCSLGDTIQVDTDKRIFTIRKTSGQTRVEDVVVYENEFFWKYVKEHTRLTIAANTSFVK